MGLEIEILDWIQNLRTPVGDVLLSAVTKLGNAGIIWILLTLMLLAFPKTRKAGAVLTAALLVDLLLCNVILKNAVARIRPYDVNTAVELLIKKPVDYSFPSGHTAASFAAVAALYLCGKRRSAAQSMEEGRMDEEGRMGQEAFGDANSLLPGKLQKLWIPALVLAIVIAFSRLYLYVHYPTDVLGGMLIGVLAGGIGYRIAERLAKHRYPKAAE